MYIFNFCYKEIIFMHAIRLTFRDTKHLRRSLALTTFKYVAVMHQTYLVAVAHSF